jgi:small basic protein (TIGR04137 family)
MSVHSSLVVKGKLKRMRNVYTRAERIAVLLEQRKRGAGDSVFGLPKVTVARVKVRGKKKKKSKDDEE